MSSDRRPRGASVHLPQNSPQATGEAESRCFGGSCSGLKAPGSPWPPVNQNSLVREMPAKAQVDPGVKLDAKDDDSSAFPGMTGEKTTETLAPTRHTHPNVRKDGTLLSWLKTSKSIGHINMDKTRDSETDVKEKLGKETKRNMGTDTVTKPSTASNPASKQVFDISNEASIFTFQASSPFDGALPNVKKPALSQDIRPGLVFLSLPSTPNPSPGSLFKGAHPVRLSDKTPQQQSSTAVRSMDTSVPKPRGVLSPPHDRENALPTNTSARNFYSDRSPSHDGRIALPSGIFHGQLTPDTHRLGNTTCGDVATSDRFAESKPRVRPFQSDTLVPTLEGDRNKSVSAIKAEEQGLQQSNIHQLPSPTSAAPVRYNSSPATFTGTPSPRIWLQHLNALDDSQDFHIYHSASSPSDPFTSAPSIGLLHPNKEEGDDFVGRSLLVKEELDAEDDSLSIFALESPSPDHDRRSLSTALIPHPSSGSHDVIWNWSMPKRRMLMLPAFFWIVQALCKDLTPNEIWDGYIYAFRVEDPQGENYMKIGRGKDIKRRIKEHKICYGELRQMYPVEGQKPVEVYHAGRVEHLVHAELTQHAIELERCPKAQQRHKSHSEWFDVEERHATAVIRKWSQWMSGSPYEESPSTGITQSLKAKSPNSKSPGAKSSKSTSLETLTPTTWRLRNMEPNDIMKMCWPLDMSAEMLDDNGIDEVGTSLRRITIG